MREPDRLGGEFVAFVLERLDEFADPVQEDIEPPQNGFIGLTRTVATGAGEKRGGPGLCNVNAA